MICIPINYPSITRRTTPFQLIKVYLPMLVVVAGLAPSLGLADDASPSAAYDHYRTVVAAGRTFEEDQSHSSAARRAQSLEDIKKAADRSSAPLHEMQAFYLEQTQIFASCDALTLLEENVQGDAATVVYEAQDTCKEDASPRMLDIEMVFEDGWKINRIVTRLSSE